jgi:hypothetical protein
MIATSRYHEIRYRASTIFLKHFRIQNKAQLVHVKQGDEYVHPRDDFLSRYAQLNSIKKQRFDETCCIIVSYSIPATITFLPHVWRCAQAINQILTTRQKEQYIRCEVWLSLRTGQPLCSEVIKNGIHEVACA